MNVTYIAAANNTTNGQTLGVLDQDVYVKKILIGLPVASANIFLYNKTVAYSGDTANIAAKITLPATLTENAGTYHYQAVYDFTAVNCKGLPLNGGNVMVDQACQLTIIWEPVTDDSDS